MSSLVQSVGSWIAPTRFPMAPKQDLAHLMKAVVVRVHGSPSVLEYGEFPSPLPPAGSKQLIVDIAAAGVNPVDYKLRKTNIANFIYPLPKICGSDLAGIVSYAPEGSKFKKGDRVFAMLPFLCTQYGSYAEKCCIDEAIVALAPENHSLIDLASIPLVATTVVQAFRPVREAFPGDKIKGKKCFITAGTGGLGSFAVQYCSKWLGMEVATSCSSHNFDMARDLGATTVFDYKTENMFDHIQNYDVVFDAMGYMNEEPIVSKTSTILKPSTTENPSFYIRIASSPSDGSMSGDPLGMSIPEARVDRVCSSYVKEFLSQFSVLPNGIRYHFVLVSSEGEALREVSEAIRQGTIRPVVQERIPLREAKRSHEMLEEGHVTGKLVLVVNDTLEGSR